MPEVDDYPARSLGAALAQIGVKQELSLVAVSPVLRKQAQFPWTRPQGLPVTGSDVLNRLTAKEGGAWSQIGECYALVTPPKLIALRRTPEKERQLKIKADLDALFKSLTPTQTTLLRGGRPLGFEQLEPEQLAWMGNIARVSYSLIPAHDMDLVQNPMGWSLQQEGKSVIFGLAPGNRAPVLKREW
jgi:hypothetical protein